VVVVVVVLLLLLLEVEVAMWAIWVCPDAAQ
jgi:hypothetical protein